MRMNPIITQEAGDILESERFLQCWETCHHKGTNVARHSLEVAEYALYLYEKRHRPDTDVRDVVRACLLHDIGMTDRKVHDSISFIKAYAHPRRSAQIAREEFGANQIQLDAILHHMWPVCFVPPSYEAGWFVLRSDKHCANRDVADVLKNSFRPGSRKRFTKFDS
jgi:putative nucleotidyltransferase with HDIG domain